MLPLWYLISVIRSLVCFVQVMLRKRGGNFAGAGGKKVYSVLKVAHHGSKNSTKEELLKIIQPNISLISAGKGNRYGHPHKETLERLNAIDSAVYSTIENGAITLKSDGNTLSIVGFH